MRRRLVLFAMWTAIVAVISLSGVALGPRLVAQYYISRLSPAGTPQSDTALRRLEWLGRWAAPSMLDVIQRPEGQFPAPLVEPEESDDSARPSGPPGVIVVAVPAVMPDMTPEQCRAELCTLVLLRAWNKSWLRESQQRQVLRRVACASIAAAPKVYTGEGTFVTVRICSIDAILPQIADFMHSVTRYSLVLRDATGKVTAPLPRNDTFLTRTGHSSPPDVVAAAHSFLISRHVRNDTLGVPLRELRVGKHLIYVKMSLGISLERNSPPASEAKEPPWFEDILLGPAEVEIVAEPRN